ARRVGLDAGLVHPPPREISTPARGLTPDIRGTSGAVHGHRPVSAFTVCRAFAHPQTSGGWPPGYRAGRPLVLRGWRRSPAARRKPPHTGRTTSEEAGSGGHGHRRDPGHRAHGVGAG